MVLYKNQDHHIQYLLLRLRFQATWRQVTLLTSFIYLGNVLDLGTPSDDTVTGAKIVDNAINTLSITQTVQ